MARQIPEVVSSDPSVVSQWATVRKGRQHQACRYIMGGWRLSQHSLALHSRETEEVKSGLCVNNMRVNFGFNEDAMEASGAFA